MQTTRLLIVDDDASFREAQKRVLRTHCLVPDMIFEVLDAANGEDAMQIVSLQSVDVILLDQDMPGGSGLEWLKRIRSVRPDQTIIMVTGHGSEQLAVESMKGGASDYLVKGAMSPADVQRAILNVLRELEMHRTIEKQREDLIQAERQRVMIESLGAACHHMGQPATVISTYLQLMKRVEQSPEMIDMIEQCTEAAEAIHTILQRLRSVSQYRTVPYISRQEGEISRIDERILDV